MRTPPIHLPRLLSSRRSVLARIGVLMALAFLALAFLPLKVAGGAELPREVLDRLSAELREQQFSGVLEAASGGRSVFRQASREDIDTSSVFWVGSVSKQFAAVAALRLVERGQLSLDEPLAARLGLGAGALQLEGVPCSLEHVLHHTCGLPSGNVCTVRRPDDAAARAEFLRCVGELQLESRPGEKFAYSNVGYDLVGVLVSRAAGIAYGQFLKQELFEPLSMQSSGVDLLEHPTARGRLIQGEAFNGWGWSRTWPWLLLDAAGPGTMGAAGNVFSTVDDLHRWNTALHGGRVLSATTYARFITPGLDGYGLGIAVERSKDGTAWFWHNGSLAPMGWSSFVAYIPSQDLSLVGLANRTAHTSHVMRATRALVLAALGGDVGAPILKAPEEKDLGMELFFFIVPVLVVSSAVGLGWKLVRGPRGKPLPWYGAVLQNAALYFFSVSLFDFFDRALAMSPPALVAAGVAIVLHRAKLPWPPRLSGTKQERRKLLVYALGVALVLFVSTPVARLWFVGFVVVEALVLYFAVGRLRPHGMFPTLGAEPAAQASDGG